MNYKIINYTKDNINIGVRYDEENHTIWLTQSEIALIFSTTKNNITKRTKAVISDSTSDSESPLIIREESINNRKTKLYNLSVIQEISDRSKSESGSDFIEWANILITNYSRIKASKILLSEDVKSKIYIIRGEKVMLDFELAELYGYTTKAFNQQVSNNIEKFENDFMFQLTNEELDLILRSKNFTSSWGGTRYLPYAFTEQGVYMLMTVLKGELATKQSKMLIRTFKAMKEYITEANGLASLNEVLNLANSVNANTKAVAEHSKEISNLKDGMSSVAETKKEIETIKEDNKEIKLKLEKVMNCFYDPSTHKEFTFYDGNRIEAAIAYQKIYKQAKYSIIVIDDYIGYKTLKLLMSCNPNIKITIITDNKYKKSDKLDSNMANDFTKETNITIDFIQNMGRFHARFIIIDYKTNDERIYLCSGSSKDGGNKIDVILQSETELLDHTKIDNVLLNPKLVL